MAYFPMYVDLTNKPCLIIGGGAVAFRKATVLLDFNANVTVVAKAVCDEIKLLNVNIIKQEFDCSFCIGKELVICATDNEKLNLKIADFCKLNKIPVNVVDNKEASTFIFPSYIKEQNLVASVSSAGNSPLLTQILRDKTKITPFLGELNELLGKSRNLVQNKFKTESERKSAYKKIYDFAMAQNLIPTIEKVEEIIDEL